MCCGYGVVSPELKMVTRLALDRQRRRGDIPLRCSRPFVHGWKNERYPCDCGWGLPMVFGQIPRVVATGGGVGSSAASEWFARFYRFHFGNVVAFFGCHGRWISGAGRASIDMAPGWRNEIMIDLSDGSNATLVADLLPADPEDVGFWSGGPPQVSVVELRVDSALQVSGTLPDTLNDIAYFDREDAASGQ